MLEPRTFFIRTQKEQVEQSVSNVLVARQTPSRNLFDREATTPKVLLRIDTGLDVVTALMDSDFQIRIVTDLAANPILMTAVLREGGTYDVQLGYSSRAITPIVNIPRSVPFQSVAVAVSLVTARTSTVASSVKGKREVEQGTYCNVPNGTIGFAHDNICSFGSSNGVWKFWWPCAGDFEVNLDNCCKLHDQKLFCAENEADRILVDWAFCHCIMTELIRRGEEEMSWWCEWLFLPLLVVFAGLGLGTIADVAFLIWGFTYSGDYVNFSERNLSSCLCGGDKPTLMCNTDPTNPNNYLCGYDNCCRHASGQIIHRNGKPCLKADSLLPPCPDGYAATDQIRKSR